MITLLNRLVSLIFWPMLWAVTVGLLIWYPLRWWPGDHLLPVRLLNYFMPWLLIGLGPILLLALMFQHRWLAVAVTANIVIISLTWSPLFFSSSALGQTETDGAILKILSHNIFHRDRDLTALVEVIKQQQPDIVLLQEVIPPLAAKLNAALPDLYPTQTAYTVYDDVGEQALMSRFPIVAHDFDFESGLAQKVILDTPHGPIAVWNVHPTTPLGWELHQFMLTHLIQDIAQAEGPLVVGGDFNTTYGSEAYRGINALLQNSYQQAGDGFGFTYPVQDNRFPFTPVIRIDHIFFSPHFVAQHAETLEQSSGSNHRPIVVELQVRD